MQYGKQCVIFAILFSSLLLSGCNIDETTSFGPLRDSESSEVPNQSADDKHGSKEESSVSDSDTSDRVEKKEGETEKESPQAPENNDEEGNQEDSTPDSTPSDPSDEQTEKESPQAPENNDEEGNQEDSTPDSTPSNPSDEQTEKESPQAPENNDEEGNQEDSTPDSTPSDPSDEQTESIEPSQQPSQKEESPAQKDTDDEKVREGTFTLSFDSNGGKGDVKSIHLEKGETISLPPDAFTKFNAKFMGWNFGPEQGGVVKYANGAGFTMGDSDVTLYAVWRVVDPNLEFSGNPSLRGKTLWARGVTPPKESDWKPVRNDNRGNKTVVWKPGLGWYDTDQFYDRFCWGAVTSSVLQWWLEQNADYIERYKKYHQDFDLPRHEYRGARDSDIYGFLRRHYPNQGNKADLAFLWFVSGTTIKKGAGFFKDVFQGKLIKTTFVNPTKKDFNEIVTDALQHDSLVSRVSAGHATAVWGARYDDNGVIDRIYYTQSRDYDYSFVELPSGAKGEHSGMLYIDIVYVDGVPSVLASTGKDYIKTFEIITYSLGRDIWEDYFKDKQGY